MTTLSHSKKAASAVLGFQWEVRKGFIPFSSQIRLKWGRNFYIFSPSSPRIKNSEEVLLPVSLCHKTDWALLLWDCWGVKNSRFQSLPQQCTVDNIAPAGTLGLPPMRWLTNWRAREWSARPTVFCSRSINLQSGKSFVPFTKSTDIPLSFFDLLQNEGEEALPVSARNIPILCLCAEYLLWQVLSFDCAALELPN